jgi:hypothetical protein
MTLLTFQQNKRCRWHCWHFNKIQDVNAIVDISTKVEMSTMSFMSCILLKCQQCHLCLVFCWNVNNVIYVLYFVEMSTMPFTSCILLKCQQCHLHLLFCWNVNNVIYVLYFVEMSTMSFAACILLKCLHYLCIVEYRLFIYFLDTMLKPYKVQTLIQCSNPARNKPWYNVQTLQTLHEWWS